MTKLPLSVPGTTVPGSDPLFLFLDPMQPYAAERSSQSANH